MGEIIISDACARELIKIKKIKINNKKHIFPKNGSKLDVDVISIDKRNEFKLSLIMGSISLSKCSYNKLYKTSILLRLDLGERLEHKNPDDNLIVGSHIHIYKEGFEDKWAYPLDLEDFPNTTDFFVALNSFFSYCNITDPPVIVKELF